AMTLLPIVHTSGGPARRAAAGNLAAAAPVAAATPVPGAAFDAGGAVSATAPVAPAVGGATAAGPGNSGSAGGTVSSKPTPPARTSCPIDKQVAAAYAKEVGPTITTLYPAPPLLGLAIDQLGAVELAGRLATGVAVPGPAEQLAAQLGCTTT